jgi:hypothetical protein
LGYHNRGTSGVFSDGFLGDFAEMKPILYPAALRVGYSLRHKSLLRACPLASGKPYFLGVRVNLFPDNQSISRNFLFCQDISLKVVFYGLD